MGSRTSYTRYGVGRMEGGVEVEVLVAGSRGRGEGFDGSLWDGESRAFFTFP